MARKGIKTSCNGLEITLIISGQQTVLLFYDHALMSQSTNFTEATLTQCEKLANVKNYSNNDEKCSYGKFLGTNWAVHKVICVKALIT